MIENTDVRGQGTDGGPKPEDIELLRRYAEEKSETAFRELVQRHIDRVYAGALRRVGGDAHLAEDVTQHVFTALASQAAELCRRTALAGWLFTTTRFAAAQVVRTERRRHAREQEAFLMNELTSSSNSAPDWERLRPVLDEVMDDLKDEDREAVLLRFVEGRSFADVGTKLRLAENAARMRVDRSLEKMRVALARRGVTSTTSAMAAALSSPAIVAAPVGLAATVAGAAIASGGAAAGIAAATGSAGTVATFMSMTKLQLGLAGALAAACATGYVVQARSEAELRQEMEALRQEDQQVATLRTENQRLAQSAAEFTTLRQDDAELARMRDEAEALRAKLKTVAAAKATEGRTAAAISGPIFDVNQIDQIPQPRFQARPIYPVELRQARTTGEVLVDFVVDVNGDVANAFAVRSSNPAFEEAAIQALNKWKFGPGRRQRQPVNTHMQIPIVFTLSEGEQKAGPPPTPVDWF